MPPLGDYGLAIYQKRFETVNVKNGPEGKEALVPKIITYLSHTRYTADLLDTHCYLAELEIMAIYQDMIIGRG